MAPSGGIYIMNDVNEKKGRLVSRFKKAIKKTGLCTVSDKGYCFVASALVPSACQLSSMLG